MARIPTAPVAAGSIVAGFLVARRAPKRALGTAVLAPAAAWCTRRWARRAGTVPAAGLLGVYVAAVAGSHPLAKKIGTWPAVFGVAGATGAASWLLADRRAAGDAA